MQLRAPHTWHVTSSSRSGSPQLPQQHCRSGRRSLIVESRRELMYMTRLREVRLQTPVTPPSREPGDGSALVNVPTRSF